MRAPIICWSSALLLRGEKKRCVHEYHAPTSPAHGPYFSLATDRTVTGQAGDGLIDSFIMPHCFLGGLILGPCRYLLSSGLCKQISCCPEWQLLTREPSVSRTGAEQEPRQVDIFYGGWRSEWQLKVMEATAPINRIHQWHLKVRGHLLSQMTFLWLACLFSDLWAGVYVNKIEVRHWED